MNQYDGRKGTAVSTLAHYLRLLIERSGGHWDEDNTAEVESIVDSIAEEALAKFREEISPKK